MSKYLVIGLLMMGCTPTWKSKESAIKQVIMEKNAGGASEEVIENFASCVAAKVVEYGDAYKCELNDNYEAAFKRCVVQNNIQLEVVQDFAECHAKARAMENHPT